MTMKFTLHKTNGMARRGTMTFNRPQGGYGKTPAFMPVGTYGTVKGMTPEEVRATGAEILHDTFHLWLRLGQEIMRQHGDLHDLCNNRQF